MSGPASAVESLLERMADPAPAGTEPDAKGKSWHAFREAEALTNLGLAPDLRSAASSGDKKQRANAIFALSHLAKNAGHAPTALFLLARVPHEPDAHNLGFLLDAVARILLPADADLTPILHALADTRWQVRGAAIRALRASRTPAAEDAALRVATQTSHPQDLILAHATLATIGTPRSLPLLDRHLASRKRDVKASARAAIDAIHARHPPLAAGPNGGT